jgi:hypothetical protein
MNHVEPWEVWKLPGGCLLYLHSRFGQLPDTEAPRPESQDTATMMPFGKYRGAPLAAIVNDFAYVEWLLRQPWFGERFPKHWQYLADCLARTRDDAEGPSAA